MESARLADLFDEGLRAAGRGVRLDTATTGIFVDAYGRLKQSSYAYIASARSALPNLPPVHLDFVDDGTVGACAFRHEGAYFIGINGGVLPMLHLLFSRMLRDPSILPHIGDPEQEDADPAPFPQLVPSAWAMEANEGKGIVRPKDGVRWMYYRHLVHGAVAFLVSHELTHITHGHVDLIGQASGHAFLAEFDEGPRTEGPMLDRQTMEMDADCGAACSGAGSAYDIATGRHPMPPLHWAQFYQDMPGAIRTWCFAVGCLFRLFGDARFTREGLGTSYYPPPRLRQFIALGTGVDYIHRRRDESVARPVAEALGAAVADVERAFQTVMASERSVDGLRDAFGEEGVAFRRGLNHHWENSLRPRLLSHAFGELPKE